MTHELESPSEQFDEELPHTQDQSAPTHFSFTSLASIRRRLLDLSGRNSLLNFKHPKASCIRIIDELPDQIYSVLESGAKFTFIPVNEPTEQELIDAGYIKSDIKTGQRTVSDYPTAEQWAKYIGLNILHDLPEIATASRQAKHQDTNLQTLFYAPELEARLRSIRGAADVAIEESGANILYLALGFLEWYESRESEVARLSPLFTLPVQLERSDLDKKAGAYRYTLQLKDDGLITNVTLREKLANDFDLILPAIDEDTSPESYFQIVQQTVLKHQPRWKLRRQASLVLLNFTKQAMYEDLDPKNWPSHANIEQHPLVQKFFASHSESGDDVSFTYESEHKLDDIANVHEQYPLIYDADSSQHSAIIDIVNGKNLVIEGPPGSGKSQTITNLIAASIARGHKVLFVAEKMAALNVVKSRLDKAGLGDFCLELHSHKTNKQKILSDLNSRLSKQDQFTSPPGIDADIDRYENLKSKLNDYVEKINGIWKNTGLSIHQILQKTTRLREQYSINPSMLRIDGLNGNNLTPVRQNELSDYAHMLGSIYLQISEQAMGGKIENHFWYGVENTSLTSEDINSLIKYLKDWSISLDQLEKSWYTTFQDLGLDKQECCPFVDVESLIYSSSQLPDLLGGEAFDSLESINQKSHDLSAWLGKYEELHKHITELSRDLHTNAIYYKSTPEVIYKIVDFLKSNGYPSSEPLSTLAEDLIKLNKAKQILLELETTFLSIRPSASPKLLFLFDLSSKGLQELLTFVTLLEKLPSDLWKYRDEIFDNVDLDDLIPLLKERVEYITPYFSKLKEEVAFERLVSSGSLKDYRTTLENGGLFKWFSSEWRAARKAVLSLSSKTNPNKKAFLSLLPEIITFAEEQEKIARINKENPILGNQFQGIETPIERIHVMRKWYKDVRQEYGIGFGERVELGSLLLKIDRQFGLSLIDEANKNFKQKILEIISLVSELNKHYPYHSINKSSEKSLCGDSGLIQKLSGEITLILDKLSEIVRIKEMSLEKLKCYGESIQDTLGEASKWQSSDLLHVLKPFNKTFSLAPNEYSELNLAVAKNILTIAKVACGNNHIKQAIEKETSAYRYEYIRKLSKQLSLDLDGANKLRDSFQSQGKVNLTDWLAPADSSIASIISRNLSALNNPNWLNTWLDYIRLKNKLYGEGFKNFIHVIETSGMGSQNLQDIVSLVVSHQLAREVFDEHSDLANFTGLEQTAIQQRFRDYDHKLLMLQRKRVAYKASRVTPPAGVSSGKVVEYSEVSLIKHEVTKKTKHIAVRSLIKRAGRAIQDLKPCFMMSPMSVAQYLEPGRFNFDLVVMDEASQIRPEDALGAIARGSRLVVVGDPKQLPPTNFFNKMVIEDPDEEIVGLQDSESILESVMPMFNTRRLRWHYRSKHESLIAFSNKHFYDSDLVLFPSPFKVSPEFGVKLSLVGNGRFFNRRNVEEASELVRSVAEHLVHNPKESVGLVAMNAEQKDEIERQLDQLTKENPALYKAYEANKLSEEPLFIKNLENVQGDERDVIYISMTYGPEQVGGRTMQRFGPINSDVGWRRLNVLLTRSKKRMHIYSSMTSGDVLVGVGSSRGVKALKAFLEYAENGHLHNSVYTGKAPDSDFEIAVLNALQKHGYECEPQLGVAGFFLDIAVKDPGKPGRFVLGIECDGATYHSAKSARDRDRLRQDILESLGWKIRRIWSTDWFKNPQAQLQSILRDLETFRSPFDPESTEEIEESSVEIVVGSNYDESDQNEHEASHSQSTLAFSKAKVGDIVETGGVKFRKTENGYERVQSDSAEAETINLRDRLVAFDKSHIRAIYPDTEENNRLLRQDMLEALLEHLPCSKAEFLESIPAYLRTGTSINEAKLLDPVLRIIADYS
jgi:very-short-patch-repair endonuclease